MILRADVWKSFRALAIIIVMISGIIKPLPTMGNTIVDMNMFASGGAISGMDQLLHMKVMTYNIRHGRGMDNKVNLERIADDIRLSKANVIALQEVDRFNIRSGFKDQVKVLAEMLDMNWAFAPSLKLGFTQYGNAVLSKYPIERSEVYVLPGSGERRTLLKVIINCGDEMVTVFNTHLGLRASERTQQLEMISEIIEETEGNAILMGDFNMENGQGLFNALKEKWQKIKLKVKSATVLSGHEIDHIFVNRIPIHVDAWTMSSIASDHNPVIAEFNWGLFGRSSFFAMAE